MAEYARGGCGFPVPWWAEADEFEDDYPAELEDPDCPVCEGEGGDPLNDYVLPCPECGR